MSNLAHEELPPEKTSGEKQRRHRSYFYLLCFFLAGVGMVLPYWNTKDPVTVGLILLFVLGPFVAVAALRWFFNRMDPKAEQVLGLEIRRVGEHPANGVYVLSSTPLIVRVPLAAVLAWPVYQIGAFYFPGTYPLITLLTAALVVCLDYRKAIVLPPAVER